MSAVLTVDQLYFCPCEIGCGGNDIEKIEMDFLVFCVLDWGSADQDIVQRYVEITAVDTDTARRVTLRIAIDEQSQLLGRSQAGSEVDCRRRLSDPAFLIRYSYNSAHGHHDEKGARNVRKGAPPWQGSPLPNVSRENSLPTYGVSRENSLSGRWARIANECSRRQPMSGRR